MNLETVVPLSMAVSLSLAAIHGLWKLLALIRDVERTQDNARHSLRSEFTGHMLECEARLTKRVEALEEHSTGYREWRETRPGGASYGRHRIPGTD